MKKSKRLISLILAVVMVLSFMAMSASAATTEVQPRATCPKCGGYGYAYWKTEYPTNLDLSLYQQISRGTCTAGPSTHVHYKSVPAKVYSRCSSCGLQKYIDTFRNYCPYGGIS